MKITVGPTNNLVFQPATDRGTSAKITIGSGGSSAGVGLAYNQANAAYDTANSAANTVRVSANSDSTITKANGINFINTASIIVNVESGTDGNANVSFSTGAASVGDAYDQANTARETANNAYDTANTKLPIVGGTITGNLTVSGNLEVLGNSTTLNVETLIVEDNEIILNGNVTSTPSLNAFISINRGTSPSVNLKWNELSDKWEWSDDGSNYYSLDTSLSAYSQANNSYSQANAAYDDANTRVLKAGDTMTGTLAINFDGVGLNVNSQAEFGRSVLIGNSNAGIYLLDDINGFASLEVGGPIGGYIDFKLPIEDDFDFRIINQNNETQFISANTDYIVKFLNANVSFDANTLFVDVINKQVGIGTNTPDANLTVVGNANIPTVNSVTVNATNFITSAGLDVTTQANNARDQANAAYDAANTRVLRAGDTMTGNLNVAASLITQNVIPSQNLIYSLGSPEFQFKDLYVGGNTVYIGDAILSSEGSEVRTNTFNATVSFVSGGLNVLNQANAAFNAANNADTNALNAYEQANTARNTANDSYAQANTARDQANSAYDEANLKFNLIGGTISGNVIITGNLEVLGNSTTLNVETLSVEDNEIILNSNVTGSPVLDAFITINRGNTTNAIIKWDEATDQWKWADGDNVFYAFDSALDSYNQANTARDTANDSYTQANTARDQANTARNTANDSYAQANTARDQANTARSTANDSYAQANTARDTANDSYAQANTARSTANDSYTQANTARDQANTARDTANNSYAQANTAHNTANGAYEQANGAYAQANGAYEQANGAYSQANGAYSSANGAYSQANGAYAQANSSANTVRIYANSASELSNKFLNFINTSSIQVNVNDNLDGNANISFNTTGAAVADAYEQANAARDQANTAYGQANSAYAEANLKLNLSGGTINGSLNVSGNLSITGNTTYYNVTTYSVDDPLIYLAANNDTSDLVDIGFMGGKNTAGVYNHTGLARDAGDGTWYLFDNLADEGHINNVVDFANTTLATLRANINANSILLTGESVATQANLTLAHNQANTARDQANTARSTANDSYDQANTARDQANASYLQANAARDQANTARDTANDSYAQANNAYAEANLKLNISGGTITGSLNIDNDLVVVETSKSNTFVSTKTALAAPNLTHFNGERLRLYDFNQVGHPNYAVGVEQNHIWMGVDSTSNNQGWKWYGNTAQAMRLGGNGVLQVANTVITNAFITATGANLFDQSNIANTNALNAYSQANNAYTQANNAANTSRVSANSESTLSSKELNFINTASILVSVVDSGDGNANISFSTSGAAVGDAYLQANTARDTANDAYGQANAAYDQANNGYNQANTARDTANDAYGQANTARDQANTARDQANTARDTANDSYGQANNAYAEANLKLNIAGGTITGNLIVSGNLEVLGNSTTLNVETLSVEDNEIILNSNVAGAPSLDAFITINRGSSTNATLKWDEATGQWKWADGEATYYAFDSALDAYSQANTARDTANDAYTQANTARDQANTARDTANDSYGQANSAYDQANTARSTANDSYTQANTARDQANTARNTANDSYAQANTARDIANGAYEQANGAYSQANGAYSQANGAYAQANSSANTVRVYADNASELSNKFLNFVNTASIQVSVTDNGDGNANIAFVTTGAAVADAYGQANAAYIQANNARDQANTARSTANDSYDQANTARSTANDSYAQANTARNTANDSYSLANAAYDQANTARDTANDAYAQANTSLDAYLQANNAYDQANTARSTANDSYSQANVAYNQANTARDTANDAYGQANNAYDAANNAQVTVYANSESSVTTQNLNFVNTSTVTVSVTNSGGNANVELIASGSQDYSYNTTTTSIETVDSWSANTYRSGKYQMQVSSSLGYLACDIMLVHNGDSTLLTQYGNASFGDVGSFTSDINSGLVRLRFTASDLTSRIRFYRSLLNNDPGTEPEVLPTDLMTGSEIYDLMNTLYIIPTDLNA